MFKTFVVSAINFVTAWLLVNSLILSRVENPMRITVAYFIGLAEVLGVFQNEQTPSIGF